MTCKQKFHKFPARRNVQGRRVLSMREEAVRDGDGIIPEKDASKLWCVDPRVSG
jgi:hypothetical protein